MPFPGIEFALTFVATLEQLAIIPTVMDVAVFPLLSHDVSPLGVRVHKPVSCLPKYEHDGRDSRACPDEPLTPWPEPQAADRLHEHPD